MMENGLQPGLVDVFRVGVAKLVREQKLENLVIMGEQAVSESPDDKIEKAVEEIQDSSLIVNLLEIKLKGYYTEKESLVKRKAELMGEEPDFLTADSIRERISDITCHISHTEDMIFQDEKKIVEEKQKLSKARIAVTKHIHLVAKIKLDIYKVSMIGHFIDLDLPQTGIPQKDGIRSSTTV